MVTDVQRILKVVNIVPSPTLLWTNPKTLGIGLVIGFSTQKQGALSNFIFHFMNPKPWFENLKSGVLFIRFCLLFLFEL